MMAEWTQLREKFEDLRRWEKRKHRERLLIEAFAYAVLASLVIVPLREWLPRSVNLSWTVGFFFITIAVVLVVSRRWRGWEFLRTLNRLDRALALDERALTAWDILRRRSNQAAERLVLEEAEAKLENVELRTLFKREFGWQAYVAPILLILFFLTPWVPVISPPEKSSEAVSLAEEVKQLASQLEKEAQKKDLAESARVARELAEVADKELRGESDEKELGYSLGAIADSIEDVFQSLPTSGDVNWPGLDAEQLSSLQKRIRELKGRALPNFPSGDRRGLLDELGLGSMTNRPGSEDNMSENEVRGLLDRLAQEARAEQERRLLDRTQEALSELLLHGPQGSGMKEFATPGSPDGRKQPRNEQGSPGSLPGDAPARPGIAEAYDPAFRAKVRSHLQGLLGEGPSRGFGLRGEGRVGRSTVPEEEVVVRYEHQIEEQMASEEIPADFKDTIKNYFLSLGVTKGAR